MRGQIGEINIICTDLERSLVFYRDLLGFDAVRQEGPAWHLACGGQAFLLLAVAKRTREPVAYCGIAELSFDLMVDDLQDAKRQCEVAGVHFVKEFKPSDSRFFIHDPDGLVIEIIQNAIKGGGRKL